MIHPCTCTNYNGGQCYNCLNGAHEFCDGNCNQKNSKHLGLQIVIKSQTLDEEIKKEIYQAARYHSTHHSDPSHVSRHHFIAGAIWAFGNDLVQRFINESTGQELKEYKGRLKKMKEAKLYDYFKMRDGWKEGTPSYEAYDLIVREIRNDIDLIDTI